MSCALTTQAVRDRIKTVTRRRAESWVTLRPGDELALVERSRGLAAGAEQVVLAHVEVISVRVEELDDITNADVAREGFPDWTRDGFVEFYRHSLGIPDGQSALVRRIEWVYLD